MDQWYEMQYFIICINLYLFFKKIYNYLLYFFKCWYYAVNDVLVSAKLYYPLDARLKSRSILSPRFEKVYSVVRHPLNHISSFTSHLKTSYQFIKQYMVFSNYSNIFDWKIFVINS